MLHHEEAGGAVITATVHLERRSFGPDGRLKDEAEVFIFDVEIPAGGNPDLVLQEVIRAELKNRKMSEIEWKPKGIEIGYPREKRPRPAARIAQPYDPINEEERR